MRKIIFTNSRGQSIEFYHKPFLIESLTGIGGADTDLQTQKAPYQHGTTFVDQLMDALEPSIEIVITETDLEKIQAYRDEITRVCNPSLGEGLLELEHNGKTVQAHAAIDGSPSFPDKGDSPFQRCMINFYCPNGFWLSPSIEEEPTFETIFEFPFEGTFEMGIQRDNRIIDNDSDVASPLQIEFYGEAVNPKIENLTTGEYIKVNQTLAENEVMKIDTTPGQKSVVFEDLDTGEQRNVFNWIDLESTFFQLVIGENEIEYTADSDIQGADVNIYWQKQYVGV